jgi:hypothetical protein
MTLQLGAPSDAFLGAGACPAKAGKAAEQLAGYKSRLARIEGKLTTFTWMVGTNIALVTAVLFKLFH